MHLLQQVHNPRKSTPCRYQLPSSIQLRIMYPPQAAHTHQVPLSKPQARADSGNAAETWWHALSPHHSLEFTISVDAAPAAALHPAHLHLRGSPQQHPSGPPATAPLLLLLCAGQEQPCGRACPLLPPLHAPQAPPAAVAAVAASAVPSKNHSTAEGGTCSREG